MFGNRGLGKANSVDDVSADTTGRLRQQAQYPQPCRVPKRLGHGRHPRICTRFLRILHEVVSLIYRISSLADIWISAGVG